MEHAKHDRRSFLRVAGAGGGTDGGGIGAGAGGARTVAADDLCDRSALELIALIRARKASAREVMAAHLARIRKCEPDDQRDRRQAR